MTNPSGLTNMDAIWLEQFAEEFAEHRPREAARLLAIARNLQGLDEATASQYDAGLLEGARRARARSNVAEPKHLSLEDGKIIEKALAQGKTITKLPLGATTPPAPKVIVAPKKAPPAKRGFSINDL